jgi:tetratricopeptide (TPR) repeat protein
MIKKIVTILIFIITANNIFASDIKALSDSAEYYYTNQEYQKAIDKYNEILEKGYESGLLYFNLANAYYKINKINDAILNYERAKILLPGNKDIEFNLEMAKRHITDKIPKVPEFFLRKWYKEFRGIFSSDVWAIISLSSFVLLLTFILIFFLTRSYLFKKTSFWLSIILLVISISSFTFSYQEKERITNRKYAIIFEPVVNIKASPNENATNLFVLHEGTKVEIRQSSKDWVEIKIDDGTVGWIKRDLLVVI